MFARDDSDVALPLDFGRVGVIFESSLCVSDLAVTNEYSFTFADTLDDLYTTEWEWGRRGVSFFVENYPWPSWQRPDSVGLSFESRCSY